MSFADDYREDMAHILTSEEHEEKVEYQPRNGQPREVRCIIEDTVEMDEGDFTRNRQRRAEVTIAKDELNALLKSDGTPYGHGGVIEPQDGDTIYRKEQSDPAHRRYTFRGEVIEHDAAHWTLKFVEDRVDRAGTLNVRGGGE